MQLLFFITLSFLFTFSYATDDIDPTTNVVYSPDEEENSQPANSQTIETHITEVQPDLTQEYETARNIDLKEVVTESLPTPKPTLDPESHYKTEEVPQETNLTQDENQQLNVPEPKKSLYLLNSEVPPGTSTRLGWSAKASFGGIASPTAVLVINGLKPGPTLCLTAAVHGDELNGIEMIRRLMYNIEPQKLAGAVIGVPIVNIQGFQRSSRYLTDRRDLNRFFPGNPDGSSAARIAYSFFTEVIVNCDYLIDLHTGSFKRTNLPQLRADLSYPEVKALTKKMGAIVVLQSEGAEGSLRRAAVENAIPAVTLEAGGPHQLDQSAIEHGVKSIEHAMDELNMVNRMPFWERLYEPVYYQSVWVRTRKGGMLFSKVKLGEKVSKGETLGIVTDPITNESAEIKSPYKGMVLGMAYDQVMFPGFAAYHIGLAAPADEVAQKKPIMTTHTPAENQNKESKSSIKIESNPTKTDDSGIAAESSPIDSETTHSPPGEDSEE